MPTRYAALHATHFPPSDVSLEQLNAFASPAQRRLIYEEAFLFQQGMTARRRLVEAEQKPAPVEVDDRVRESSRRVLPFKLTAGQRTALKEIVDDMRRPHPMNRLLQGDVGAGKTLILTVQWDSPFASAGGAGGAALSNVTSSVICTGTGRLSV